MNWGTVHGFVCHLVKDHGEPKGRTWTREKALNNYGVPVSEIEEYERVHGPIAGPKNQSQEQHSSPPPGETDG
jgi:hypothetical protein